MIMIAGTIKNAVNLQALDNQWQQKKECGDIFSKGERNERAALTQEERMLQDFKEQMAQNKEACKRTDIANKIMHGDTLTPEEEQYLQEKDPAALQKYKQMKVEKKVYEEKLKRCKTKDEVQRLKTETLGQYVAALKKIVNNPCIPMSEKLAKAQEMLARTRNIQDAEMKFMQTAKYANLPTEAEEAEQRAEEKAAENEQNMEMLQNVVQEENAAEEEAGTEAQEGNVSEEEAGTEAQEGNVSEERAGLKAPGEVSEMPQKAAAGGETDRDYLKEIEDTYEGIQLNIRLMDEEEGQKRARVKADSEKYMGRKVNISI